MVSPAQRDGGANGHSKSLRRRVKLLRRSLADSLATYRGTLRRALTSSNRTLDAEAVHDVRVATRRLSALMKVARRWQPGSAHREALDRLGALRRAMSRVRDWDVRLENLIHLRDSANDDLETAALEHVLELTSARAELERDRLKRKLDHLDVPILLEQLKRVEWDPHGSLRRIRREAVATLSKATRRAFAPLDIVLAEEALEPMHEMRLAVKRWRYGLEALGPLMAGGAADLIALGRSLQDLLGRHHDLVVLAELLERVSARLQRRDLTALTDGLWRALRRVSELRRAAYELLIRQTRDLTPDAVIECVVARMHDAADPRSGFVGLVPASGVTRATAAAGAPTFADGGAGTGL